MDVDVFQKELEKFVLDHKPSARVRQQNDLIRLNKQLERLEVALSAIHFDCFSLGYQYWKDHNLQVFTILQRSHAIKNSLIHDIKIVRRALREDCNMLYGLQQLIRDWYGFVKSIHQTQEGMQYLKGGKKNNALAFHKSLQAVERP